MITHYIKTGFRNICQYKRQSIVSILGLAVGFVCFAFSALWIRYEMTYNRVHPDSERIHLFLSQERIPYYYGEGSYTKWTYGTGCITYLKENYPEIEDCVGVLKVNYEETDGQKKDILQVTPGFFKFFGVEFLSGNEKAFFSNTQNMLITDEALNGQFVGKSPLGESLSFSNYRIRNGSYSGDFFPIEYKPDFTLGSKNYTINGVVKALPSHSDFRFDYIMPFREHDKDAPFEMYIFVKLRKGVDPQELENKWMQDRETNKNGAARFGIFSLYPLQKLHYSKYSLSWSRNMSMQQIVIFAGAGLVTILCLLFNYLSLFVARLQQKRRELALQMVLGASFKQLYLQMSVEFLMILFGAFIIGCFVILALMPTYLEFTGIQEYSPVTWLELIGYFGFIVLVSQLLLLWPLYYIRRRAFSSVFRGEEGGRDKKIFSQNILLMVQLVVSIVFLFCTSVFVKQMHYMKNIDPGFNPERLCFVDAPRFSNLTLNFGRSVQDIQQFPEIESATYSSRGIIQYNPIPDIVALNDDRDTIICQGNAVSASYFDVCGIQCLQGELFREEDPDWNKDKIVINESMAKLLNRDSPIGESVKNWYDIVRIIGVVPDVFASGLQIRPIVYRYSQSSYELIYRYKPGMRATVERKVRESIKKNVIKEDIKLRFSYMDDRFETERKEDMNFMRLLYILSAVCIIGSMFGIYSMVSLVCERRRKEIAVRKINGAGIGVLIKLFLKKYIVLLAISSAIAFPVGYLFMKPWMEQFVRQTSINVWLYVAIFISVAIIITLIVISRIWKTLHANPAMELRKE